MSFVQLRFTHSKFDCEMKKLQHLLKIIIEYVSSTEWIYCMEEVDKFGKKTNEHFHLNLYTDKLIKKDTLQKKIRSIFHDRGIELKGNKMYSVRVICDPEDEDRWWRYCCKEEGALIVNSHSFENKIKQWKLLATDEREIAIKRNNKTIDGYLDKSSFKGKMYLNFTKENIKKKKVFIIALIKYYMKKSKVPPFSKLEDYWLDYRIQTGIITVEEYYELRYYKE